MRKGNVRTCTNDKHKLNLFRLFFSFPHDCAENYRLGLVSYETSVLPRLHHPQHGIHFDPGKRNNSGVALRTQHIASFGGRAVVLIRNPFDAIVNRTLM